MAPREAHTSLGGKLVSWIKLHSPAGDSQKIADNKAFREALSHQYDKTIGPDAFRAACNACGINDGKAHSLTPQLILKTIAIAERAQLKKEGGVQENGLPEGAVFNAKAGVIQDAEGHTLISTRREFAPERSFVHYTVETNEDLRVSKDQVAHAARQTLESQLDDIELKYGPDVAATVKEKVVNRRIFERLFREQSDKGCAYQLDETVDRYIKAIWTQADAAFVRSLPQDVKKVYDDVMNDLALFSDALATQDELDEVSECYGINGGLAQAVYGRDSIDLKQELLSHRRQLADFARVGMIDKLSELSKIERGYDSLTLESFENLFAEAIANHDMDPVLLTDEHIEQVKQQAANITVETDPNSVLKEPSKSALKSTQTNYEAIEQAAPSREEARPRQRVVRFG